MASITNEKGGKRSLQFVASDGHRKSIRLGKVTQRQATSIKMHVERLLATVITRHSIDEEASRWLAELASSR